MNLNEDGERGPATITGRTRDHEGNIHEGKYSRYFEIGIITSNQPIMSILTKNDMLFKPCF